MTQEEDLMTVNDVAAELKVPLRTVQYWCRYGHLPAKKFGRDYMVRRSELVTFKPPRRGRSPK